MNPRPSHRARGLAAALSGPLWVGAGMSLLGAGSYAFLIVAGRALPVAQFGRLASLWAFTFGLVGGLAAPFEQEAVRAAAAYGRGLELRRIAVALWGTVAAAVLVLLGWWLADPTALAGLVGGIGLALVGLPVAGFVRGALIGSERFAWAGTELCLEGVVRAGGAIVLVTSAAELPQYAVLLGGAPVLAALLVVPVFSRLPKVLGPRRPWNVLLRELATLAMGSGFALIVLNLGPLLASRLGGAAAAGEFTPGFSLARLPVFFAGPVAATLMPRFVRAHAAGTLGRTLRRHLGRLALVAVPAVGLLALVSPPLVGFLYGPHFDVTFMVSLLLAISAGVHLLALVAQSALVAASKRGPVVVAWAVGAVVLVGLAYGLPGELPVRIAVAYVGSAVATLAIMVWAGLAAAAPPTDRERSQPRSSRPSR